MSSDLRADLAQVVRDNYSGDFLCSNVVHFLRGRGVITTSAIANDVDVLVYRAKVVNFIGPDALTAMLIENLDISEVG